MKTKTGSLEPSLLLDSSLILTTKKFAYNAKIVDCNEYIQVYLYENSKTKTNNSLEPIKLKEKNLDIDSLKKETETETNTLQEIELKNVIRSKLKCQRLAKANMDVWETFITLTFEENIKDIQSANKKFRYFIDKLQRVYKDLKYICVPEFQKRGAVHYHLFTNISPSNNKLIYKQENNSKFLHIKYWNEGFNKVDVLKKQDAKQVVGYISKYMTKDIDNRLYNRHRYYYSRNLKLPIESCVNLSTEKGINFYKKIIQDKQLIYNNQYINSYDNSKVTFLEYLK